MPSEFLPAFMANAELDGLLLRPAVLGGTAELRDALELCSSFRVRGISAFLLGERPQAMHAELARSGWAFAHFLRSAEDVHKVTSRSAPFFDAMAAGDQTCAAEIARHSRRTWDREREFEEDFLYFWFLMSRYSLGVADTDAAATLTAFETALGGAIDLRLELCRALLDRDDAAFHDTLCARLEAAQARTEELTAAGLLPPWVAATEGAVSTEGLALLRLAEKTGLRTDRNYPTVPSTARIATASYPPDAWRSAT